MCEWTYRIARYGGLLYGSKVQYVSDHEISYTLGKYIKYFILVSNKTRFNAILTPKVWFMKSVHFFKLSSYLLLSKFFILEYRDQSNRCVAPLRA